MLQLALDTLEKRVFNAVSGRFDANKLRSSLSHTIGDHVSYTRSPRAVLLAHRTLAATSSSAVRQQAWQKNQRQNVR